MDRPSCCSTGWAPARRTCPPCCAGSGATRRCSSPRICRATATAPRPTPHSSRTPSPRSCRRASRRCSPGPRSSSGAPRRARRGPLRPAAPRARHRPGAGLAGRRAHVGRGARGLLRQPAGGGPRGGARLQDRSFHSTRLPRALLAWGLAERFGTPYVARLLDAVEPHHLLRAEELQQLRVPVHLLWGRATSCSPPDTSSGGPVTCRRARRWSACRARATRPTWSARARWPARSGPPSPSPRGAGVG